MRYNAIQVEKLVACYEFPYTVKLAALQGWRA